MYLLGTATSYIILPPPKILSWLRPCRLCSTAIRRDIRAAVFLTCELPHRSVECFLLRSLNAKPYIFAVVNCSDVALSVFYSPVITRCRIAYFCSYELLCLGVGCCVLLRSPNLER